MDIKNPFYKRYEARHFCQPSVDILSLTNVHIFAGAEQDVHLMDRLADSVDPVLLIING